jgi:two-component system nitrate/nitrite response regulator NarL
MGRSRQAGEGRGRPKTARTIIIDDQLVFRLGLRMYLGGALREIEWLGEAESVEAGLALMERTQPDLVLVDAFLGNDGIGSVLGRMREKCPACRLVVFANYPDSKNLALAASSGADGYMLKTLAPDQMVVALQDVLRGVKWIQPDLAQQLYAEFARDPRPADALQLDSIALTPRQLEVLRLVAAGLRNSEIADKLTISEQTVKTHVAHLLEKLGVSSRLQAARYAISRKLVDA